MTLQVNEPSAKYLVRPQSNNEGAGIPPCGWQIKPLGELSEFITSGSRGWASYYKEHGATFIRSQNVLGGQLDFNDHQCVVPPVGSEGSRTRVEFGDLLITITGNSVGNVAYVDRHLGEAYISQHVGLVRLKDAESAAYICRFLSPGAPGNSQIVSNQSGQSKPGLNLKNLRDFVVSMPPKEEQRAIATALSDVDALIAGLEKLIAKKRDLKQAAMQQLLTGQTRLPGFSGAWVVKKLGDIAEIEMGQSPSSNNYNTKGQGVPLIQGNADIRDRKTIRRVFTTQITKRGRSGDFLLSVRAPVGEVARATFEYCIGRGVCAVRTENDFLYHALIYLEPSWARLSKGSTFDSVNSTDVAAVSISIPGDLKEQVAIASALADIDTEIAVLDSRLAKSRDLKQGMMQELLTGRTRLV
jgi:type I restriction enzyme S subunit